MASRFRTIIDKICGLDDRFRMLNERLTLIEETIGINTFMADSKIVTADGTVGVGSTVPPDVARYEELKAKTGNVGVGSTSPPPAGNVGVGSTAPSPASSGNVGVGSTAPAPAPAGNVGTPDWDGAGDIDDWARKVEPDWDGTSVANEDQASALYKARAARTAAPDGNVGIGSTAPDPDFS